MLNVCGTPLQAVAPPPIGPGCGGALPAVTASVLAVETCPQAFVEVTETVPVPAAVVAVIVLVVLVPLQPAGKVHV
jgi:hypothetical protein